MNTSKFTLSALALTACSLLPHYVQAAPVSLSSPDGNLRATIDTSAEGLTYSLMLKNRPVLEPSALGVTIDGQNLGQNAVMGTPSVREVNETYATRPMHSTAVNHYREALVPVTGGTAKMPWTLEVRAFNDGVAYRYRVPGQGTRRVEGEASAWKVPAGSRIWYQGNNKRDYEAPFQTAQVDQLKADMPLMAPATFKLLGDTGYLMLTEANLINYSDMALVVAGTNSFRALFHNDAQGWTTEGEIVSPWRVAVAVSDLNALVNTDILRNLSPAPAPELVNAAWIQPGRSTWHWMVTGGPALEHQNRWVDWTQQLGFEYYLIDDGWVRWSAEGKDQWAVMKDVVDYARTKNVKIWAWVHSRELRNAPQRQAYFKKAKEVGIVGVKIDFMGPANTTWVQWYDDTLRDAAAAQLMVNFHGSVKPSGRDRTWPHEMTREGIRGREMGKQPALHDTTLPFVRFVQGHADFTPTDFRLERLKSSSWAHELAQAIVYTSPFLAYSGSPENYLSNPAIDVLKAIPSTWDETIVLPGSEIGEMAAYARRKGDEWFIGVVNGGTARPLTIDLSFLGAGNYTIDKLADTTERNDAWNRTQGTVTKADKVTVDLRRDGGFVARIRKAAP